MNDFCFDMFKRREISDVNDCKVLAPLSTFTIPIEHDLISSACALQPTFTLETDKLEVLLLISDKTLSITRLNRIGERTAPCFTPRVITKGVETEPLNRTAQVGFVYQLLMSLHAFPFIPEAYR